MAAAPARAQPEHHAVDSTDAASRQVDVLAQGLTQLAARLAQELQGLDGDGRLRRAVVDIPDARSRLDAVATLMEQAAHTTLDLVEQAQHEVRELRQHDDPDVVARADRLRDTVLQVAEAQGFQDLSGQILGRVNRILESMHDGLQDLIVRAGLTPPSAADASPDDALAGPQVAGLQRHDTASQGDADALLEDLGL
ncbi:MAG: protein phosphatase CheZ [Oceanococcaceae bacterium]